jgi:hypothetical protein
MNLLLLQLPREFEIIVEKIKQQDWLLSFFPASEEELYNPAGYVYNNKFSGVNYKILLDRNIFRFIVSASFKKFPNEKHRAAIALIYFCQAANIGFEPNLAVYERLLPKRENTQPAIEEFIKFYQIDNANSDSLLRYAIGENNSFEIHAEIPHDTNQIHENMIKYQWLTEWRSLYLILLKIVVFDHQDLQPKEKLKKFMLWIVKDFRLSLPCIIFAIFIFSRKRFKNMNKVKRNSSSALKLDQIYNMTWDVFLINSYFRKLTEEDKESEYLIATDDQLVKSILRAALGAQEAGSLHHIKFFLNDNEHDYIDMVEEIMSNTTNRIYDTDEWIPEYRDTLIAKAEDELLKIR